MKQVDCVVKVVTEVMGIQADAYKPTKEQRELMIQMIQTSIMTGETDYSLDKSNQQDVKNYCSGLLSNHLRKDKRLNGGIKYEAKNPGSRTGNSDPKVKELRKIRAQFAKAGITDKIAIIDQAIAKRLDEIKPTEKVIDVNQLNETLETLLGKLPSDK